MHNANLSRATLAYSDLGLADLSDANLSDVDLTRTKLDDTNLTNADLTGADLWEADLSDAKGVTQDTLVEQAGLVIGTTMPDGHVPTLSTTSFPREEYRATPGGVVPPGPFGMSIQAREYDSDEFAPAFHFEVDEGWQTVGSLEKTDFMALGHDVRFGLEKYYSETSELIVTNPLSIVDARSLSDARNLSELQTLPAPESANKWASWFQEHPNLETSEPKPVIVGGAPGIQLNVTDVSLPENYSYVPVFITNLDGFGAVPERKERFLIVDVGEETVVINVSVPPEESFSKAENLLDNIKWTGL